jgi:hypothetical protein
MNLKLAVTVMMTCALLSAEAQAIKESSTNNYADPQPNIIQLPVVIGVLVLAAGTVVTVELIDFAKRKLNPKGTDWWPDTLWSTPGTDGRLAGKWTKVKDRKLPCGGCWYKCSTGAAAWLQSTSGDEYDKNSVFFWAITDREFNLASTCYAMSEAPGLATPDDWNVPGQSPMTQWWHGGVGQLAWPGITNFVSVPFGFTTNPPAGMQSLATQETPYTDTVMMLGNPEFLGTNDSAMSGNFTNWCSKYGVRVDEPQWNNWNGGKWGYNGQPANFGGNPGGLPWITNYCFYDSALNKLKLDLRGFNNGSGTMAVMFYVTNYPNTTTNGGDNMAIVPMTITGSQEAYTYTIQRGGSGMNDWGNVIDMEIVGDGSVTFLDNFAGEHQSYRIKATK